MSPTDDDADPSGPGPIPTTTKGPIEASHDAEEMFSEVVRQLHGPLYAMAIAITANQAVADDAVAGAYASTWSRFRRGDIGELDRYLWRSVARQARRMSLLHRRQPVPFLPATPLDPADVVTHEVDLAELLVRLPVKQRTVVALKYIGQFSEPEVAELLGLPLGTVKSRLARAVAALRVRLVDTGSMQARGSQAPDAHPEGSQP